MKLLCINDKFNPPHLNMLAGWPVEGEIYSVRKTKYYIGGKIGYLLNEVINTVRVGDNNEEPTFHSDRFVILPGNTYETLLINAQEIFN